MGGPSELKQKRTVYVVEPHPLAAEYLAAALRRNPAIEIIPSGVNLPTDAILSSKSSVLIVDGDALPLPPVAYLRTVREALPGVQILVVGKRASDDELCRLLLRGVRGFLACDEIERRVCEAVEALFKGHTWAPPAVLDRFVILSTSLSGRQRLGQGALSSRESDVVSLLQRRLCDKEISSLLGISERTVRFHLQNVFNKLGVHDRHSVIEWVRTEGAAPLNDAPNTGHRGRRRL
jgi:two-component system response regulator NreC